MTQHPHFTPDRPEFTRENIHHKNPYTDQLVVPLHQDDDRIRLVKPRQDIEVPVYNDLYDSLRTKQAWRHTADNFASGTLLTVASSQVKAQVNLAQSLEIRLERWPGAVQFYLSINQFSLGPQVVPATAAIVDAIFQDATGGFTIPLGEFMNTTGGNTYPGILIPVPITDPGITNVGNLLLTDPVGGTTVATFDWQFTFGYVYVLASVLDHELRKRGMREENHHDA